MLIPLTATEQMVDKMHRASIVLEVWDKIAPNTDDLLGLVKLPLNAFGKALIRGTESVINSVYPIIAID